MLHGLFISRTKFSFEDEDPETVREASSGYNANRFVIQTRADVRDILPIMIS